jgi:HD-like signal output (HDOD) protein
LGIVKLECQACHKVYQIPEERLPKDKEIAFPCPACKATIRLNRSAEPSAPRSPAPAPEGDFLQGDGLKARIVKRVTEVPPMPQTVFKARELLGDPRSSFDQLASILESDQGIATRVLKMSNSAFYGMMGKVSSLQHASRVLGFKTLAEIVSMAGASTILGGMLKGYQLSAGDLWKHSLAVAFGAKLIAGKKKPDLLNDAFAAGLIHDSGKLVLDPYVAERKTVFEEFMAGDPKPFLKAEKEILGFDHAEIAFELCKAWNVPQPLIKAVRYHHSPGIHKEDLVQIIHLADGIAMMSGIGAGLDGLNYELDEDTMKTLGIEEEEMSEIMAEVVESVQRIATEMKS